MALPCAGELHGVDGVSYIVCKRRYFRQAGIKPSGVRIFRHAAAKLRRDAGESIEDVSRFLDHGSLGVTTVYLCRLEGEQDRSWAKVAQAIGV